MTASKRGDVLSEKVARLRERLQTWNEPVRHERLLSVQESGRVFSSQGARISELLWQAKTLDKKVVDRIIVKQLAYHLANDITDQQPTDTTSRTDRGRLSQTAMRLRVRLGAEEFHQRMKDNSHCTTYDFIDFISKEMSSNRQILGGSPMYQSKSLGIADATSESALRHQIEESRRLRTRSERVLK
ncbi:hypothetical protein GUITHDRAFT_109850 [Guillardia theta CCMP2712]|uniref:Uncharacterized protein n=2 Tax=Guillardia theta TaxID=55529 RepID=L1J696_GUITC|nr:hypothetical protein GUITHDRAFT_109850 [Guillardia theta CCMP2712]EKX44063.1 hypothetical protein GUITHDRAFT_109850 [Guillardia theta CCMP2712]|eukprot:XP_005831043.1 hypothetical protein GUITHDRAFT_109850 [Guillardia theta CCMP2712]